MTRSDTSIRSIVSNTDSLACAQHSKNLKICRVMPSFQTRLRYAEHYVANSLKPYGVETSFVSTDHVLSSLKHLVPYESPGEYRDGEFCWLRLKSKAWGQKPLVSLRKLLSIVQSNRHDLFHLSGIGVPLTVQFLLAHRMCKSKTPIVVSDHTTTGTSTGDGAAQRIYYQLLGQFLWKLKSRINRVISFCPQSCDLLSERFGIPRENFHVIPLGYDAENFQFALGEHRPNPATYKIGFAGKVSESKRLDSLIRAIGKIADKRGIELHIAGLSDCSSDLQKSLLTLAAQQSIHLESLPLLDAAALSRFYNQLDLAVFPGSISITTLEASGCGTPIIVYRSIEGIQSRVENGRGNLFETQEQLVALIRSALATKETIELRHRRAKSTASEYSWQSLSVQYLDLYSELICDRNVR